MIIPVGQAPNGAGSGFAASGSGVGARADGTTSENRGVSRRGRRERDARRLVFPVFFPCPPRGALARKTSWPPSGSRRTFAGVLGVGQMASSVRCEPRTASARFERRARGSRVEPSQAGARGHRRRAFPRNARRHRASRSGREAAKARVPRDARRTRRRIGRVGGRITVDSVGDARVAR